MSVKDMSYKIIIFNICFYHHIFCVYSFNFSLCPIYYWVPTSSFDRSWQWFNLFDV